MKKTWLIIAPLSIFALASCKTVTKTTTTNDLITTSEVETSISSSSTDIISSTSTSTSTTKIEYTGYYEALNSINLFDQDTLVSTLNGVISKDLKSSSYANLWTVLAEADAYDDDNIECFYTGQLISKTNHGGSNGQWNREHVWAKTYGFGNLSNNYAYYDAHHLHATEVSINSNRANLPFDEVDNPTKSDSYGNKWDSTAFEPRDEVKGDVARSLFYMVVRYGDTLGLTLKDTTTLTGGSPNMGKLSTLLKWAYEDPVSEKEIKRNEAVYKYQNNRNPFIDHPELTYYLYQEESNVLGVYKDDIEKIANGDVFLF